MIYRVITAPIEQQEIVLAEQATIMSQPPSKSPILCQYFRQEKSTDIPHVPIVLPDLHSTDSSPSQSNQCLDVDECNFPITLR